MIIGNIMSYTAQDKEVRSVRAGDSFFFAGSNTTLANAGTMTLHFASLNEAETFLRSIIIISDAVLVAWQMYTGVEITGGTDITLNSRNYGNAKTPPMTVTQDASISVAGTALFPDARRIYAQTAPGNNSFMYQELLTGSYIVPKDSNVLLEFTNLSDVTIDIQVAISCRKNI